MVSIAMMRSAKPSSARIRQIWSCWRSAAAIPGSLHSFATAAAATSQLPPREQLNYDVCIVGAGPAGLAAAIKLKQLCSDGLSVCVLEKGSEVGAHILSGNVLETRALDELLPGWKDEPDSPAKVAATKDQFVYLASATSSLRLPTPRPMHNKGNYVVSLSEVCRWLGKKAEALGVDVFPGFAAGHVRYDWGGAVVGVGTNDVGVGKDSKPKANFTRGVDVGARVTLLAEGCRGSLTQSVMERYRLREDADPQTYALGLKEVWEVPESQAKPGLVIHTVGFPLDSWTYGGGFLYHMAGNKVALGLVISLDYSNPNLNTFQEFQRWKSHPLLRAHIEGGTCLQYGARSLNEGGLQSIPKLTFPGGALIGCSAGFLNVPKIKGTHTAMYSGMMAAEAAFRALKPDSPEALAARTDIDAIQTPKDYVDLAAYEMALRNSWLWDELTMVRNIRPAFQYGGLAAGIVHGAVDTYLMRGKAPWTLHHRHADHETLKLAKDSKPIEYPKPDGKVTFDLPSSLYRSGTNHDHDQPSHLQLKDPHIPVRVNLPLYGGPETRYCPAGVYEYQNDDHGRPRLQINAQNCLHCKACDIKDPSRNIRWTVPEGGGGPSYTAM